MKNLNARTVLIILLVIASLSSYIFLQTESSKITTEHIESVEPEIEEQSKIFLPDVELVKKVIHVSRTILHPFQH
jgi:hypothetical protein